jgi:hypothetical protein
MASLINTGIPLFYVFEEENPKGQEVVFGGSDWDYNDFSISANFDALIYAKKGVVSKLHSRAGRASGRISADFRGSSRGEEECS